MARLHSSRDRFNLDDAMRLIGAKWAREPNIVFDPDLKPQYRIRRQSQHDGTLLFSIELLQKALMPLFDGRSYFKPNGPTPPGMTARYTIGRIKRMSVYGNVDLPCGNYPGERERVVIPVRCDYVPSGATA